MNEGRVGGQVSGRARMAGSLASEKDNRDAIIETLKDRAENANGLEAFQLRRIVRFATEHDAPEAAAAAEDEAG